MNNNWSYITACVHSNFIEGIDRNDETRVEYYNWKNSLKKRGIPPSKYIHNNILKFSSDNKKKSFVLRHNDFPYDFADNVSHFVIWANPKIWSIKNKKNSTNNGNHEAGVKSMLVSSIEYLVEKMSQASHGKPFDENPQILVFENPTHKKSVRSIPHFHVLIRNGDVDKITSLDWYVD